MMKFNKILFVFCLGYTAAERLDTDTDSDPNWNSDDGYGLRHSYPSKEDKVVQYSNFPKTMDEDILDTSMNYEKAKNEFKKLSQKEGKPPVNDSKV